MKNLKFSYVLLIAGFISISLSCSLPEDSGGSGAEFDASLYYTKDEVNSRIADKVVYDSASPQWIPSGAGFSNKTTGWAVPDGATVAVFEIKQMSTDGNTTLVYFGETDTLPTEVKFIDDAGSTWAFVPVGGKAAIFAWADIAPSADNLEVSPVMWVK